MVFGVNTSPFAGRDGRFVTSRQIKDRLDRELLGNVSIRFSPDGSRIVFNSRPAGATNFDLYSINPDGTGLVRLTTGPANEVNPAWSPDGAHIVYTSDLTGVGQVYVMDADGSDQVQLTFDRRLEGPGPGLEPGRLEDRLRRGRSGRHPRDERRRQRPAHDRHRTDR